MDNWNQKNQQWNFEKLYSVSSVFEDWLVIQLEKICRIQLFNLFSNQVKVGFHVQQPLFGRWSSLGPATIYWSLKQHTIKAGFFPPKVFSDHSLVAEWLKFNARYFPPTYLPTKERWLLDIDSSNHALVAEYLKYSATTFWSLKISKKSKKTLGRNRSKWYCDQLLVAGEYT